MKLYNIVLLFFLLTFGLSLAQKRNVKRTPRDYVPDAITAIKIAEAIWLPIYGNEIYKEKPFIARLKDSAIWIVKGTPDSTYSYGGAAYIEIRKRDGQILKVTHGK